MGEAAVSINGKDLVGWKDVVITRSMQALTSSFTMSCTDSWNDNKVRSFDAWAAKPGDACEVSLDSELILTGYIDQIQNQYDGESHEYSIQGRDKTGDLVDCSPASSLFGDRTNQDIAQIARALIQPFGLVLIVDTTINLGAKFQRLSIDHGSTVFDILEMMSKMRGLLFTTDNKGRVFLTSTGNKRSPVALVEGNNVLQARLTYDHTRRFKNYYVYGQAFTSDEETTQISRKVKGSALDNNITRYRPKSLIAEREVTTQEAIKRAQWESTYSAGKSVTLDIRVNGWRQGELVSDPLWEPNNLVEVSLPFLGIEGDMLIESVAYRLTENEGEITELQLTKPDAWIANPIQKEETKQFIPTGKALPIPPYLKR